jgi:prepilin-type N-terminal cleavage/methylation domain-containing protein
MSFSREKDRPTPQGGGLEDSVLTLSKSTQDHRGFSLIEMMVASAIFAMAAAVAFIMYSAAQKSYKSGENLTGEQQSTRVAFDRMISDLRLAGFNTNPDGDTSRVDEQVEGAWDTAVTIRGDFDFEDAAANATPETALRGTVYNVVSTGNDEIVTYVLAKPGPSGTSTLAVNLDADKPRAKTNKTVTIPNAVVVQNDPPYTLYRVTLADVTGAFPNSPQASTNFVFEPVAENIRSMTFRYFDDGGVPVGTFTPTNSADDIGGADASSVTRARIRKVHVDLVGMTEDPDLDYVDTTDASATTHYRKFSLDSDVNMENMGRAGIRDLDVTAPPSPSGVSLVTGHAKGMLVKWNTPASTDGVSSYVIRYWPNGSPSSVTSVNVAYPHTEYGVIDFDGHGYVSGLTHGASYCFQVQSKDAAGNQSGWGPSTAPCATTTNTTTPSATTGLTATGNGTLAALKSKIELDWTDVQNNTAVLTGDPDSIGGTTILRDSLQYKIWRCEDSSFTGPTLSNIANSGPTVSQYSDASVINCKTYYYKVQMEDQLNVTGAMSSLAYGQASTTVAPAKPTGLVGNATSKTAVTLTWNQVSSDAAGDPETINSYKVYRAMAADSVLPQNVPSGSFVYRGTATVAAGTPLTTPATWADTLSSQDNFDLNHGNNMFYVVTATDLCGNESVRSDVAAVNCPINITYSYSPADLASNGGVVPITLTVSGPDNFVRAKARITRDSDTVEVYNQETFSYPFSFPAWNTTSAGAGIYTITWEVENSKGCIKSWTSHFTATAALACQITPTNPNLSPTNGKPSSQNKNLSWDVVNNSGKDLDITKIDVGWTNSVALGTHKILSIQYPTGTTVISFGTGATTTATADFSFLPLLLPASANGICGTASCVINMLLAFDTKMVDTSINGETITIKYYFKDTTNSSGTCFFSIKPDLTIQ